MSNFSSGIELLVPVSVVGHAGLGRSLADSSCGSPSSSLAQRFTLDGDDAMEKHLADVCENVSEGIRAIVPLSRLEGLLLAGGYGRGEGGVLTDEGGDKPYNDLEFYVFLKGSTLLNDRRYKRALHQLGERLSQLAGIEVEFKILSLHQLRRSGTSMFSYDFVTKHRWLIGDESLFAGCDHHRDAKAIPLHEATRLLFNRCTGLLYAKERFQRGVFTKEDGDFVGRNLAKAQLGIGDAIIASRGEYHWSCMKRRERLAPLSVNADTAERQALLHHHDAGVVFKLHPRRSVHSRVVLSHYYNELSRLACKVWLTLETERLGKPFASVEDYAFHAMSKCPEQSGWRNALVNLRAFREPTDKPFRYPRERLFHALALLLWDDFQRPAVLAALQRELRTKASDFPSLVHAYEQLWHQFN